MGIACSVGVVGQRKAARLALATMLIVALMGLWAQGSARGEAVASVAEGFTAEEVAEAAHAMDVPSARAAEDLEAQREGRTLITELIESGDQVWFDNATTMIHVYGAAKPAVTAWCERRGVPLHVFPWQAEYEAAGLARDALYLLRPDTYVAMADANGSVDALAKYFVDLGIRPGLNPAA